MVHAALPKKLAMKVQRRTITRRLAERGYTPQKKVNKSDPGPALAQRRVKFAEENQRTRAQWNKYLQAVGDVKEFTYYPLELRPKLQQLRASWTYMRPDEKNTNLLSCAPSAGSKVTTTRKCKSKKYLA